MFFDPYLKRYWSLATLGGCSILAIVIAILAIGRTLHPLIQSQEFGDFQKYLAQLCGCIMMLALASFGRSYGLARLSACITRDIKRAVLASLLQQELSFYDQQGANAIIQRFQEHIRHLQQFLSTSLGILLRNSFMMCGGLVMLFATSPLLTLLALAAIPAILLPITLLMRLHRQRMKKAQAWEVQEATYTAEIIQNIAIVQAFTAEEKVFGRATRLLENSHQANHQRAWIRSLLATLVIFLVALSICAIVSVGVHWVNVGRITPGALASFLFFAVVVAATFSSLTDLITDSQRAYEAFTHLQGLQQLATPAKNLQRALPDCVQGILAVHHVSFAYPHHPERCVLANITLSAARGDMIAIVGPSGAGKSTLFSLLLGFYAPQTGQVFLDGMDQAKIDLRQWRQHFGFVPQEPFIFADTLYNNIKMNDPSATAEKIWQALEEVALDAFAKSLPQGLQTPVGQGGVQLSVGQKQRLAIARILVRNPAVLLLDEPTTALDAVSEHHVQESLRQLMRTRTTLVVAHRLKTVLQATRIVVLNQGRVEATGTHAELMSQPGLYRRLATLELVSETLEPTMVSNL